MAFKNVTQRFHTRFDQLKIDAMGIPNIWAPAIAFKAHLQKNLHGSRELLLYYLKGIFCGTLYIDKIDTANIDDLRNILESDCFDNAPLPFIHVLKYRIKGREERTNDPIVAAAHKECLFFPASQFSYYPNQQKGTSFGNDLEYKMLGDIDKWFASSSKKTLFNKYLRQKIAPQMNGKFIETVQSLINNNCEDGDDIENFLKENKELIYGIRFYSFNPSLPKREQIMQDLGIVQVEGTTYCWRDESIPEVYLDYYDVRYLPNKVELIPNSINITSPEEEFDINKFISVDNNLKAADLVIVTESYRFRDDNKEYILDNPIKFKYINLLDSCTIDQFFQDKIKFKCKFKNLKEERTVSVAIKDIGYELIPHIQIFPNFYMKEWKQYYLWGNWRNDEIYDFKYISNNKIETLISKQSIRIESPPQYLELYKEGEACGLFNMQNKLPVFKYKQGAQRKELKIALDFGTSNSGAGISYNGKYNPLKFDSHCHGYFISEANFQNETRWFIPQLRQNQTIPSELFKSLNYSEEDWALGFANAGIPNPNNEELDSIMQRDRIIDDIKWSKNENHIRNYLFNFLQLIFINFINQNFSESISLSPFDMNIMASYPLTFDEENKKIFKQSLDDAKEKLLESLPASEVKEATLIIPESIANAITVDDTEHDYFIIDVGGGTTDFAYLNSEKKVIFSESLKMAGNDILKSAISESLLDGSLKRNDLYKLEQKIRNGNEISKMITNQGKKYHKISLGFAKIISDIFSKFHAAKYDYALQNIEKNKIPDIELITIGNGFKLLDKNIGSLKKFLQKKLPKKVNIRHVHENIDPKGYIINNMLWALTGGSSQFDTTTGRKSIMGCNITIGKDNQPVSWSEEIPYQFEKDQTNTKIHVSEDILDDFYKYFFSEDNNGMNGNNIKDSDGLLVISKINAQLTQIHEIEPCEEHVQMLTSPLFRFIECLIAGTRLPGTINRLGKYNPYA